VAIAWIEEFRELLELLFNLTSFLAGSFCMQDFPCLASFQCMLGGSAEVWTKNPFYIGSIRVKLMLACQEVLKWVCSSMSWNRLLSMQIQRLPLSMHHEWEGIVDIVCKATNGKSEGTLHAPWTLNSTPYPLQATFVSKCDSLGSSVHLERNCLLCKRTPLKFPRVTLAGQTKCQPKFIAGRM
jgi:hypothetical protein